MREPPFEVPIIIEKAQRGVYESRPLLRAMVDGPHGPVDVELALHLPAYPDQTQAAPSVAYLSVMIDGETRAFNIDITEMLERIANAAMEGNPRPRLVK